MKDTYKLHIQILITKNVCMRVCVCEHICCTQRLFGCSGSTGASRRRWAGWRSSFTGCCGSSSIFGGSGGAGLIWGGGASLWHKGALLCSCLRRGRKCKHMRWQVKRGRTDGTVSAAVKATNKSQTFINKLNAVRAKVGQRTTFACAAAVISSGKCWLHWEIQVKDFAPMSVTCRLSPNRSFKIAHFIQQHVSTPNPLRDATLHIQLRHPATSRPRWTESAGTPGRWEAK